MRALGFDLQAIARFTILFADRDARERCFTPAELATCEGAADTMARLAVRYAAKEATLKALGGLQQGMALTDIEIRTTETGAPVLLLHGLVSECARTAGISSWLVSLSHTDDMAGAVVMAL